MDVEDPDLRLEELEPPFSAEALEAATRLRDALLPGTEGESLADELARRDHPLLLLAHGPTGPAGFKVGFRRKRGRYYSWLGGVLPEWRGRGLGSSLIRRQHRWCREQGYASIRTHTKNKWRSMLILNLRHGFDVIGALTDEHGEPKLILEKRLDEDAP